MGRIYTAECRECNRIYNFDVGISKSIILANY